MCQVPSEDIAQIGAHWGKWSDPCQGQRERTVKEKISLCPSPSPLLLQVQFPWAPHSLHHPVYTYKYQKSFFMWTTWHSPQSVNSATLQLRTPRLRHSHFSHTTEILSFQFQNHFMSKSGLGIFLVVIISTFLCEMSLFFVSVPKPDTPDWSSARPEGTFLLNSAQSYEPPGELDLWSKLPAGCRTIKYIVLSSRIVTFEPPRKLLLPPRQKSTVSHKNFVIQIYKEEGKPKARKQGESISVYSSISSPASPEAG